MKIGILKSFKEIDPLVKSYEDVCKKLKIDYIIINLLVDNWIEEIRDSGVDGILVRINGKIPEQKQMYDERLWIINKFLNIPIYPSLDEMYLYENKRLCSYWLSVNNLPHVPTRIFYTKADALEYIKNAKLPVVFKTNSGASSSGVEIIRSKTKAIINLHRIFGLIDPRLTFGKVIFGKYGILPVPKIGMAQKHYVIIQDFVPIKWEWRIIKISNSYFGHQKLLKGDFASGSDRVGWVAPPKELLLLIKKVSETGKFDSLAMDVLESIDGKFYINELQSLFGSFLPYQMKIDDKPGRYTFINNDFIFEEGEFNNFGSNLLRVEDFIHKLNEGYYNQQK